MMRDERAIGPLTSAIYDSNYPEPAAMALAEIGKSAVIPLISAIDDGREDVRKAAAMALAEIGKPAVIPLLPLLKDGIDPKLVAETLGKIKDRTAVEPLIPLLKDKDYHVRLASIKSLGEIGGERSISALVKSLSDWHCKEEIANILINANWQPKSQTERIHFWVANKSGDLLRKNWKETKRTLLKDIESNDESTISYSLYAFISIGVEDAIPTLIEKLNNEGNKKMAEAYLNCGHGRLNDAAVEWGRLRGYEVTSSKHGSIPASWGSW